MKEGEKELHGTSLDEELLATAFHEAGHAVVAVSTAWFNCVESATIAPTKGRYGRVRHDDRLIKQINRGSFRNKPQFIPFNFDYVVTKLAGGIAERRLTARDPEMEKDEAEARWAVQNLVGSDRAAEMTLAWLRTIARERVEANWSAIVAVAAALLEKRTLSGAEIREIVEAVCRSLERASPPPVTGPEPTRRGRGTPSILAATER